MSYKRNNKPREVIYNTLGIEILEIINSELMSGRQTKYNIQSEEIKMANDARMIGKMFMLYDDIQILKQETDVNKSHHDIILTANNLQLRLIEENDVINAIFTRLDKDGKEHITIYKNSSLKLYNILSSMIYNISRFHNMLKLDKTIQEYVNFFEDGFKLNKED